MPFGKLAGEKKKWKKVQQSLYRGKKKNYFAQQSYETKNLSLFSAGKAQMEERAAGNWSLNEAIFWKIPKF